MDQHSNARDRGSYIEQVDFTDESGAAVTPISATWSLTDGNGAIVNTRKDIAVTGLNSTVYIAMSGADLAYNPTGTRTDNERILVVKATYLSSLTGTQLPLNKAVKFAISDLPDL